MPVLSHLYQLSDRFQVITKQYSSIFKSISIHTTSPVNSIVFGKILSPNAQTLNSASPTPLPFHQTTDICKKVDICNRVE